MADWISGVFTPFMDQVVIDGILHFFARSTGVIGDTLRDKFDKPIINELIGDGTAALVQKGQVLKYLQTGRVQSYLFGTVSAFIVIAALLYYFF